MVSTLYLSLIHIFHKALVRRACARLDEAQTAALCTALADLHTFFTSNDCKGENV